MKIALLVSSLQSGGSERVAATLCNAWAKRGNDVTLVATYSKQVASFYALYPEVKVVILADQLTPIARSRFGYINRLTALRKLIRRTEPDVLISFLTNVNISALLATRCLPFPVVVSEKADLKEVSRWGLWGILARLVYPCASAIVSQTDRANTVVNALFPSVSCTRVIPNPCPEEVWQHRATPFAGASKRMVMIGRLAAQKQIHLAIEAFGRLQADFPDWTLQIYGEGPLLPKLAKLAAEQGPPTRISLAGLTDDPWGVMASADAYLLTSAYEGLPNAMMEAMAIGLPCIAFDCEFGPRELSEDGKVATLVPQNNIGELSDRLAELMSHRERSTRLGASARRAIRARYALDAVLGQWDALFADLLSAHDRNGLKRSTG